MVSWDAGCWAPPPGTWIRSPRDPSEWRWVDRMPRLPAMPLHDSGAGAVSEENAGGAVLPVGEPRQHFCSDEKDVLIHLRPDEGVRDGHAVDKAGAGRINIESRGLFCAELFLQHAAGAGQDLVRRHGGDDDQVQFSGAEAGRFQCLFGRLIGEVGGGLAFFGYPALLDAGALSDPFVAGSYQFFQVMVGNDFFRGKGSCPGYPCMDHCVRTSSIFFSMSSWMCLFTSLFASSAATRMAFFIARSEERPWLMMLMPLMPISGAPPYSA